MIVHRDHLGGVAHAQILAEAGQLSTERTHAVADARLVSDEDDARGSLADRLERARELGSRRLVAAHDVERDGLSCRRQLYRPRLS